MPAYNEYVREAVVVQINHSRTPSHKSIVDREPGLPGNVFEVCFPGIAIEIRNVIREIGFENVEPAVEIVISYGESHAGLLFAVIAIGNATNCSFFAKGAIVIVQEQQARGRIASQVNVRPA